jgi:anti-sigma regulatory factor (Ser/Thr protein kinase)
MILHLHATPEEVMRAVEAFQEFGREKQLSEKMIFGLALALEECGSNIVDHAYRRDPSREFQVRIDYTDYAVTIELRDRGPEFDPTRQRDSRPVTNEEDRPPGGFGILLVRRYTDEISWRREAGENVLRLTKRLATQAKQP